MPGVYLFSAFIRFRWWYFVLYHVTCRQLCLEKELAMNQWPIWLITLKLTTSQKFIPDICQLSNVSFGLREIGTVDFHNVLCTIKVIKLIQSGFMFTWWIFYLPNIRLQPVAIRNRFYSLYFMVTNYVTWNQSYNARKPRNVITIVFHSFTLDTVCLFCKSFLRFNATFMFFQNSLAK